MVEVRAHDTAFIEDFGRRVATAAPWASELPPGPELKRVRQDCGLSRDVVVAGSDGATSVLTLLRYELGRTSAPRAVASPGFRRAITALYELALERKAAAERSEALRRSALA